jgi:hypothetical protein
VIKHMRINTLLLPKMARRAEHLGVRKAQAPGLNTFTPAVLAGAFIALSAAFATTVAAGTTPVWPRPISQDAAAAMRLSHLARMGHARVPHAYPNMWSKMRAPRPMTTMFPTSLVTT